MDFDTVVARRRMVRHFTEEPVSREAVERIIRTAQHAPSAGFSQGVAYVVVTDPETRQQVARIGHEEEYTRSGFHSFVSEAPVQVVVCTSERVYRDRYDEPDKRAPGEPEMDWPVPYWHTDAGAALMLILLAAVNEGLAAAFVGTHHPEELKRLLGIPDYFDPIGIVLIGHPAPDVPSPSLKRGRKPLETVLHWERW